MPQQLPPFVVAHLLSFLSVPELAPALRVSKAWASSAMLDLLWHELYFTHEVSGRSCSRSCHGRFLSC